MIRFNCDKCDTLIELDDDKAGTKHECLSCGDTNRVPAPASGAEHASEKSPAPASRTAPGSEDRARKAGYPADFGPEQRVFKVRRCWFRSRPFRFALALLVLVASLVGILWVAIFNKSDWWYLLTVPAALIASGFLAWWWIDRLGAAFEVTTKRTVMHRGFFSKSTSEVVHDNIRNIQVTQSLIQRILGVGRIGISSAGQDGIEISVNHLRNPGKLREIIDLYRPL